MSCEASERIWKTKALSLSETTGRRLPVSEAARSRIMSRAPASSGGPEDGRLDDRKSAGGATLLRLTTASLSTLPAHNTWDYA